MNLLDFVKAIGVAFLLMVLNVAAAFGMMWIYGTFLEPGHEEAFYVAAAQRIAPWSSVFAGALLFFVGLWLLAWRRAGRNGVCIRGCDRGHFYAAVDVSILLAAGALMSMSAIVAASMFGKLGAALAGAWLGRPRTSR